MTWSILLALQAMATAWLTAAFPQATQLAAKRDLPRLHAYWRRVGLASGGLLAIGIIAMSAVIAGLQAFGWELGFRFIAPTNCLLFGIGMIAYHVAACFGYLVRAQRRESLYWAATIGQACVAAGGWYACSIGGVTALCLAYAILNVVILLPLHMVAWRIDQSRQPA